MIGIYKITNLINNKIYVGQSISIKDRWAQHKCKAFNEKEKGYNSAIHAAFRKYGFENFVFEIIEECPKELLDEREIFWIGKLNSLAPNGYNILSGGQGEKRACKKYLCNKCGKEVSKGYNKCPDCARIYHAKNVSCAEEKPSPLQLALLVKENGFEGTGRIYEISGNAIKKWCAGYDIPTHKKDLIDWYNKQAGIEEEQDIKIKKPIKKQIQQLDNETGEVIAIFESTREAARALGKSSCSHITEVANGKLKSAYGYKWKYVE